MEVKLNDLLYHPLVISIDGLDALGKSTQIKMLKDLFESEGFEVLTTAEARGTPIADVIRSEYLSGNRKTSNLVNAYAFTADRFDRFFNEENGIITRLNVVGDDHPIVVLIDRFILSSMVYSSLHIPKDNEIEIKEQMKLMLSINKPILEAFRGCYTINMLILPRKDDIPKFASRIQERQKSEGKPIEVYETSDMLYKEFEFYSICNTLQGVPCDVIFNIGPDDTADDIHKNIVRYMLRNLWR